MKDNLNLWESVCTTDPKYTKAFSRGGGFSGTAINATYLIRKATELWGPLGGKWGYEVLDSEFVPSPAGEVVHVLRIKFRHPDGSFESFGQTTFSGKNKNGPFTDEEAPKKSLTDALTKALSMLGFSADVHLGLFDDNKYVAQVKRDINETARKVIEAKVTPTSGIKERLNLDQIAMIDDLAVRVKKWLAEGSPEDAKAEIDNEELDADEKVYLWSLLESNERSALKKAA